MYLGQEILKLNKYEDPLILWETTHEIYDFCKLGTMMSDRLGI